MSETTGPSDDGAPDGAGGATAGAADAAPRPLGPLWTGDELERATGGRLSDAVGAIAGISIDSRTVARDEAFFAIRGERFDGHQFAVSALTAGAACAVVARAKLPSLQPGWPYLVVSDSLAALADAGRAARDRCAGLVAIAVTGSVGKTGTKEALRKALSASGLVHASAASHNNHWGVPLTLARLPREADFLVSEIGMNHAGEITPLTRMVRPDIAIVTTVEAVHIEFFESIEGIARAKGEIFEGLAAGGHAVVNADNPHTPILVELANARRARITRFGVAPEADVRLLAVAEDEAGSDVSIDLVGTRFDYRIGQPGRHLVQNSLAVAAALALADADVAAGLASLADATAPRGRGEQTVLSLPGGGTALLVDEAYNANPASMRAAIAVLGRLRPGEGGRRVAVLGDMLELGAGGPDWHRGLAPDLEAAEVSTVHAAGPLMAHLHGGLPAALRGVHAPTAAELVATVVGDVRPGDVVMVKGSNGSRMSLVVGALKERFAIATDR